MEKTNAILKDLQDIAGAHEVAVCCRNKEASSSSQKRIDPGLNMKRTYLVAEDTSREGDGYAFTVGVAAES